MGRAVLFADMLLDEGEGEIFVGYVEGTPCFAGGNVRASRSHRQPNRIYSSLGIHPSIISSETQGRYYVCIHEG